MDRLSKFRAVVSQSEVVIAVFRTPAANRFMLCDLAVSIAPIADLVTRGDFVGVIGLVGLKPQAAFAVELNDAEITSLSQTFLSLIERAFIRAESQLTGLDENFLKRLYCLPKIQTEEIH